MHMKESIDNRRRQVLIGGAGVAAAAGLSSFTTTGVAASAQGKPLPSYASWKDAESLIVHSANTIETKRGALGTSVLTPSDKLFVRNNVTPPDPAVLDNREGWKVAIEGVNNPRELTLTELKSMGVDTVPAVLQCSGNGRGFFGHKASGTQWKVGAAGCVIWSGVPVAVVAKNLGGVSKGMRFITGTGGEKMPEGIDPKTLMVERSVPLTALDHALLAWELNGEPLSLAHGGPLRLIVPGYYGVNNVKYIKRLAFTENETPANIQSSGYRVRPIGEKGSPAQPTMWEMNVKSWINNPAGTEKVRAGLFYVDGVAFAGTRAVKSVDVSIDGGKSWNKARFIGPDLGPYAWRQFVLPLKLAAGSYTLVSRATDAAGNVQPEERVENERGYAHNGWRDHGVKIDVV
jgi:DMSO/TMAO reductase YedYZ molybdopterin-dependent catalytic subunit